MRVRYKRTAAATVTVTTKWLDAQGAAHCETRPADAYERMRYLQGWESDISLPETFGS
jgi:hypothetical protein